jgi:hypothetical protein
MQITCSKQEAQAIFIGKCVILASVVEELNQTIDDIPPDVLESMFAQSEAILGIQ